MVKEKLTRHIKADIKTRHLLTFDWIIDQLKFQPIIDLISAHEYGTMVEAKMAQQIKEDTKARFYKHFKVLKVFL